MARILMVIAPKNFRDEEYFEPKRILGEGGNSIATASKTTGEIIGVNGGAAEAEEKISDVRAEDFDGVIFVGGRGMIELTGDFEMKNLAKKFAGAGKLTAAICVAPAILANAEILSGKSATSWSGVKDLLEKSGARFTGADVEEDGNIITASGPAAAGKFGQRISEYFKRTREG